MAGPTLKRAMGGGAHPKFLMLTSAPRLFYVDVATSTPKELGMHASATSKATLQVVRKGRKVRLQCVIHSAEAWQREISKAPTRKITADHGTRGKSGAAKQPAAQHSSARATDASMVRQQSRNIALGRAESITPRVGAHNAHL